MARDVAVISSWKQTVRGREAKALEVFTDFLTFWGKQAAEGKCSPPEVFFRTDGGQGFAIIKGKSDVLAEITESEEYGMLIAKGHLIVEELTDQLFYTGDDELQRGTSTFAQAGAELGYM